VGSSRTRIESSHCPSGLAARVPSGDSEAESERPMESWPSCEGRLTSTWCSSTKRDNAVGQLDASCRGELSRCYYRAVNIGATLISEQASRCRQFWNATIMKDWKYPTIATISRGGRNSLQRAAKTTMYCVINRGACLAAWDAL